MLRNTLCRFLAPSPYADEIESVSSLSSLPKTRFALSFGTADRSTQMRLNRPHILYYYDTLFRRVYPNKGAKRGAGAPS